MKRFLRTPALNHLAISWMAAVGTAAWALAGTADTPKHPGAPPHDAAGPHADGAEAVQPSSQRTGSSGKASKSDQQFLTKAAASGRADVEMGRLGQMRAQNSEVKGFAERMVQDHTRVDTELQALGSARGLSWANEGGSSGTTGSATSSRMGSSSRPGMGPAMSSGAHAASAAGAGMASRMDAMHPHLSAGARHSLERLQGLTGADFDREYMKQMVTDHKVAVADFQRAASAASDPEVKAFAQKTLPGLQEHLQMARSLSDRLAGSASR